MVSFHSIPAIVENWNQLISESVCAESFSDSVEGDGDIT